MSKIRINKNQGFTYMSNYHLRDKNLSLKGKGLLSVMFSLPESWNYSVEGLVAILKESETAVISTLKELKECGYLNVIKLLPNETKTGRIEYIYDVFEIPKQEGEKQDLEILGVEILDLENVGQLNTNNQTSNNKQEDNKKLLKKENILKERNDETIEIVNEVEQMFNEFWKKKKKKIDPKGSYRAFKNIKGIKKIFPTLMQALEMQKNSKQWQNRQYIPNPTTWLHQERWVDENIDIDNRVIINHIPTGDF